MTTGCGLVGDSREPAQLGKTRHRFALARLQRALAVATPVLAEGRRGVAGSRTIGEVTGRRRTSAPIAT